MRSVLAASIAGLALAAPAAAVPFTAGPGHDPQVAAAPDGTGHVSWVTADDQVGYCRVERDAATCERTELLAFPGANPSATHSTPQVFALADGRVLVAASCWNCGAGGLTERTYVWTSADRGTTFSAPVERGNGMIMEGQGAYLPDTDTLVGIGLSDLLAMGDAPLATPPVKHTASGLIESPTVARVPGADALVAVSSDMTQVRMARYTGPLTAMAIDQQASWTLDQPVQGGEAASTESSLAPGPAGLFLSYLRSGRPDRIRLHAYDAATGTFDAGRVAMQNLETEEPDLSQDPNGELALVWRATSRDGQLRWRRSGPSAGTFSPVASLVGGEPINAPEVSAAPDDGGFVVWTGPSSSVRVMALPAPPAATYSGPSRRVRRSDARMRYRLTVPRECVHAGQRFDAELRGRPRGDGTWRVVRATFSAGGGPRVGDGSAPFRQTLTMPEFAELGSRVAVRAEPVLRRGGATRVGRTVRTRVAVCS